MLEMNIPKNEFSNLLNLGSRPENRTVMRVKITIANCADFGSSIALAMYETPVMFQTVKMDTKKYSEKNVIGLAKG